MNIAHLTKKEVLALSKACGVGDEDISDEDTVVTDYGDTTEDVLRFAEKLTAGANAEICRLHAEVERLRAAALDALDVLDSYEAEAPAADRLRALGVRYHMRKTNGLFANY